MRRSSVAFTLIELLVVIAVIALLIGILLPALGKAREASRTTACLANQRNIGLGVTLYQNQFGDHFPLSSHTTGNAQDGASWLNSLVAFGVEPESRLCPSDPARLARPSSYATNDHLEPLVAGIDFNPFTGRTLPGGRTRAYTRVTDLPSPCAVVYAVEVPGEGLVDHIHSVGKRRADQIAGVIAVERHAGGANYLHADGHARTVAWSLLRATFAPERNFLNPETAR